MKKENDFDKKLSDDLGYTSVSGELNKYYITKEFEYMSHTAKKLPFLNDVKRVAKQTMLRLMLSIAIYKSHNKAVNADTLFVHGAHYKYAGYGWRYAHKIDTWT